MSKKFTENELKAVKFRWEVTTVVSFTMTLAKMPFIYQDGEAVISHLLTIGDVLVIALTVTIIGRFYEKIYHACLILLLLARSIWVYI